QQIEQSIEAVRHEIDGDNEGDDRVFRHMWASVGEQPFRTGQANNGPGGATMAFTGSHLGELTVELSPAEERDITSNEIAQLWREKTGPIADAVELSF
ncbi:MAG: hypothetical protein GWN29_09400, partial [Gammaproteobacteria bacterium]|nr:hypothetical protein [Gammaproteobacteria bacterium]